jgi:hypothetical protein
MSAILRAFLQIPEHIRPELAAVVDRTRGQFRFSQADIELMFKVYNDHLAPSDEPEKITCSGCRMKVVGWLRSAVTEWQKTTF